MEWGTVSEWVSGIATSVAVAVALVFSLRQDREQRERKLASVYAWLELEPGASAILKLINNTDFPIYEWEAIVAWPRAGLGEFAIEPMSSSDWGLLVPGTHEVEFNNTSGYPLPKNDAEIDVELRFRDASGRARRRLSTGQLK